MKSPEPNRPAPTTAPPPAQQQTLWIACLLTAAGFVCAHWSNNLELISFFEAFHWTTAAAGAALLNWQSYRASSPSTRDVRRWFALSLGCYLIGQIFWDFMLITGHIGLRNFADLFYIASALSLIGAIVTELRKHLSKIQQLAMLLDYASLTIGGATLALAIILSRDFSPDLFSLTRLTVYPLLILATVSAVLLAIPYLQIRLTLGYLWLTGGLLLLAAAWFVIHANGPPATGAPGSWTMLGFSVGNLMAGYGTATWRSDQLVSAAWRTRYQALVRLLPLLVVTTTAGVVAVVAIMPALSRPLSISLLVSAAAVIILAALRQSFMLRDREQVMVAEQQADQQRELLQAVFDGMRDGVVIGEIGTAKSLYMNKRLADIFGCAMEEMQARHPSSFAVDPETTQFEGLGRRVRAAGDKESMQFEWQARRDDGRIIWAESRVSITTIAGQEYLMAVLRDITAQKDLAQQFNDNEALYRTIVESAQEGIWIIDDNAITTFVNPHMEVILGYTADEMIGRPLYDFMNAAERIQAQKNFMLRQQGESSLNDFCLRHKLGHDVWTLITANPLYDRQGRFSGALSMLTDITSRKAAHELIRENEERFRAIFNTQQEALAIQDAATGKLLIVNDRFTEMLGWERDEVDTLSERDISQSEPPYSTVEARQHLDVALAEGRHTFEWRTRRKDGSTFWSEITLVHASIGGQNRILSAVRDISAQKKAEHELKQSELRYRTLANSAPVGIFRAAADGSTNFVNARAAEMAGLTQEECFGEGWINALHPDDRDRVAAGYHKLLRDHTPTKLDHRLVHKDGRIVWVTSCSVPETDDDGNIVGYVGTLTDITEQKRIEQEMRVRAHYDPLTSLPNRDLLTERLDQAIKQARREHIIVALLFIDLDHFKHINDTLGHEFGDQLLQETASRLNKCVRETDTVARQGGDEFVILLNGIDNESDCALVAEKVISSLSEPFLLDDHQEHIGASIGITLFPNDGNDVATLFRNADLAMYRAKDSGRNAYHFFKIEMTEAAIERRRLEGDLRLALERNEFSLHFQPIVDMTSGHVRAAEALLRWQHPLRGMVPPDTFIPLAEEVGLIRRIGSWVLEESCRQLAQWRRQDMDIRLSINISVRQIPEGLNSKFLRDLLDDYQIKPDQLVFEITESVLMANLQKTHDWLQLTHELGIPLALDDFGTGYSSLSYLKRFPITFLKIDRSFIRDMETDPADRALIEAILAMAQSLNLSVVSEGVETAAQYVRLAQLGCRFAQGYYMSKPVPAAELPQTIANIHALLH